MQLKKIFIELFNDYQEAFAFIPVVVMGVFMKSHHAKQKGQKLSAYWFISEGIMSFCVALTAYAVFDQWLEFNKLLTYILCAWAGSFSTIFHKKLEEVLESAFDGAKAWITKKSI